VGATISKIATTTIWVTTRSGLVDGEALAHQGTTLVHKMTFVGIQISKCMCVQIMLVVAQNGGCTVIKKNHMLATLGILIGSLGHPLSGIGN
jgi:hypothetical protein